MGRRIQIERDPMSKIDDKLESEARRDLTFELKWAEEVVDQQINRIKELEDALKSKGNHPLEDYRMKLLQHSINKLQIKNWQLSHENDVLREQLFEMPNGGSYLQFPIKKALSGQVVPELVTVNKHKFIDYEEVSWTDSINLHDSPLKQGKRHAKKSRASQGAKKVHNKGWIKNMRIKKREDSKPLLASNQKMERKEQTKSQREGRFPDYWHCTSPK